MATAVSTERAGTGLPAQEVEAARDRTLLRFGAVTAVVGGLLAVVGNVLHPRPEEGVELGDVPGYAREVIGAGDLWMFAHLTLITVSVLFLLFWVSMTRAVHRGRAQAVALMGLAVAAIDTALHIVTLTIDGLVFHRAAYALDPSDEGEVAAFRALYHLLFGLFAGWQALWGVVFVLFGVAVLLSPGWPRWVGAVPVVLGAGVTVLGVVDAYREASDVTFLLAFPVLAALLSCWVIGVGVHLWRTAGARKVRS